MDEPQDEFPHLRDGGFNWRGKDARNSEGRRNNCESYSRFRQYGHAVEMRPLLPARHAYTHVRSLTLTPKARVEFNTHAFPNWTPDKFAQEVVYILENCYNVTFEKREE